MTYVCYLNFILICKWIRHWKNDASRLLLFLLLLLNHLPFFSRSKTSPFTPARIINHSCHTYLACALLSLKINPCFFFFLYNIPNTFIYKKKVSFFPDIRWIIAHNGAKKVQEKARTQVSWKTLRLINKYLTT